MGVLRLGIISSLFSDVIMSAFLTAAATLIISSQACEIIGVESGPGRHEPSLLGSDFFKVGVMLFFARNVSS